MSINDDGFESLQEVSSTVQKKHMIARRYAMKICQKWYAATYSSNSMLLWTLALHPFFFSLPSPLLVTTYFLYIGEEISCRVLIQLFASLLILCRIQYWICVIIWWYSIAFIMLLNNWRIFSLYFSIMSYFFLNFEPFY